jgi:flavin-dependent dehydrogenase
VRWDVAIVGGGTAGAAAARSCARAGLSTLALERGAVEGAGASWVNGVPLWCFDEGDLDRPVAPERRGPDGRFHLLVGWGPDRLVVDERATAPVDMRHLTARLRREAESAGATFRGGARVRGWVRDGVLDTEIGEIEASTVVDASGVRGSGLVSRPQVPVDALCTAAQYVHRVVDREGAAAWAASVGVECGDVACFTGIAGGYSIVSAHWTGDEISLLTGSIPSAGVPSGRQLADAFIRSNPWIGPREFGGSRVIPLQRPRLRLAEGRVALLGDAACQVYGAHGSGIGAQLVAAKVLADALASGRGPEGYARAWQRTWGGQFAGSAVFAAFSRGLATDDLARLIRAGWIGAWSARPTMEQRSPGPPPLRELPQLGRGFLSEPGVALRVAPVLARIAATRMVWRLYRPSRLWEAAARVVAG